MNPVPRRQPLGLLGKLAIFFGLLSLPALLLVEFTVVMFEYSGLIRRIDSGLLRGALELEAQRIARYVSREEHTVLEHALSAWLLKLERPRSLLGDETAYVLLELSRQPFSAAIVDRDGGLLALSPTEPGDWALDVRQAVRELEAELPSQQLSHVTGPDFIRRYAAPLWRDRTLHGWLILEVRLSKPWRKMAADLSFEWPVIVATLVLIAIGAAFFLRWTVTRRLNRIGIAAQAWSQGDFSASISDPSQDELGSLSHELDRMALALRELFNTRAALARISERDRLARDLHDTVKQQTFAVHLKIAAILKRMKGPAEDPVAGELERVRTLVHAIQSELTQILTGLKADDQAPLPLTERLRAQLDAWSAISAIPHRTRMQTDIELPPELQDELLKVVDEALANVLKHSGASHVDLLLHKRAGRAVLRVSDDGRGLPPTAREGETGMGLDNMRSRTAQLPGGQWRMLTGPTGGVVVEVSWVLPSAVTR